VPSAPKKRSEAPITGYPAWCVLRVCPKCLTASSEDLFCPSDGTPLVGPDDLPPSQPPSPDASPPPLAENAPQQLADPLVGQLVAGRYRVLGQLGEGGMGNVYRAIQQTIEKKVALKVLKTEYSTSADMVVRFHREAVSACRIKHPNVVDVFDLGQLDDGRFYLAMDLLEGRDLGQLLAASGTLPAQRAVQIALQICRALNAAHQSGIVHRDLKPENVFLHRTSDGDEVVKIVDFGIAHLLAHEPDRARSVPTLERTPDGSRKLTSVGMIFGTPEYMAPEQATGGKIDHRADIYATGVILYKMLTGHVPFSGATFFDVLAKQVGEEPMRMSKVNPDAHVPRELELVVMRALEKKPDDRYATMARFARALAFAAHKAHRDRSTRRLALILGPLAAAAVAASFWLVRKRADAHDAAPPIAATTAAPAPANLAPPPQPSTALEPTTALASATNPAPVTPPAPAPSASAIALDPPQPSAPASSTAEPVASVAAKPARSAGRTAPARPEPAPARSPGRTPPTTSGLPSIERCFETVAGERREVPCN
jgi:serine/threonine-protein kinase